MAILGSHNSMTFLKSNNFIYNIFSFCWRCQSNNIEDQLKSGVRCFDIRIKMHQYKWVFAHGNAILSCNGTIDDVFNYLNKYASMTNEKIYIRLILEESKESEYQEIKFINKVKELYNKYTPNLIFFEFTRKYDWKRLVDLNTDIKEPEQFVGSMKSWYGKIWPWLYWKLNNKSDKEKFNKMDKKDIALFDFI